MIALLKKRPHIIQFSPIRSGSTLVFNFLRELFPEKKITKTHQLSKKEERTANLVCTYRNPMDCVSSNLLFLEKAPTTANIREQIDLLKTHGLEQLCNLPERKNIILLRYEDFYCDHDVIFSAAEKFFGITLNQELKESISNKYQVRNVKENYASKFDHAFEFDKENHWHGNHISAFNGRPNTATQIFTPDQIQLIQGELKSYIELLGYKLISR